MSKKTHTTFQMLAFNNGGYSFNSYLGKDGEMKEMEIGIRKDGLPITKRFAFKPGHRTMVIPNNLKDKNGNLFVDFIRNHPECEGSPMGQGRPPIFRELDPVKDAKALIDAEEIKYKAQDIAFKAKGEELKNLAALCSCFDTDPDIMRQALITFAKSNPEGLVNLKNDQSAKVKASLKRFINKGVVYVDGYIHYWKTEGAQKPLMVGTSEDEAVSKLMEDDKLMKGMTEHYNRVTK